MSDLLSSVTVGAPGRAINDHPARVVIRLRDHPHADPRTTATFTG